MDATNSNTETVLVSKAELESLRDIAGWAQAILTALNVGNIASKSLIHLALRDVMIKHRERFGQ